MQKPWNDCNAETKPYYRPIEAAIRWCGLTQHEPQILAQMGEGAVLPPHYPQWPCLRQRTELILDAMEMGEVPTGRDGRSANDHVAVHRRTVRHNDLKAWMAKHHPGQKPAFLFDEMERQTHSAINADSFRALQADRDALQKRIDKVTESYKSLRQEKEAIEAERDSLKAMVDKMGTPRERAETTYQNIIAALLDCIAGNIPGIEKHPSFASEAKLIEAIEDYYRGYGGLSKSNLSRKFPEAKRALQSR